MQPIGIEGFKDAALLSSGLYTRTFSAIRSSDNKKVILKLAKTFPPEKDQIAAIDHEWEILTKLQGSPSVPRLYNKGAHRGSPLIEMEWIEGVTIAALLREKKLFPIEEFLPLALAIVNALENVHRYDVIHKDFNIFNLIYQKEKGSCRAIDFGLSVAINHQSVIPVDPRFLEGTLPYLSPEQSGRMNRGIDYRTDYYSLGITFYQLLTGTLPFYSKEPLEIVHAHIAEVAEAPSKLLPTIPEVLSSIVLKLMAKEPEGRYQSIAGIRGDLEECLRGIKEGKISPFPIATYDTHERFEIPKKIYGRENEVKRLLALYEGVMKGGHGLVMIGGPPGIGKSSLVHELYRPISAKEGEIISGKFEQFKRSIPYFAISQALNEFIQGVLSKTQVEFFHHRKKLLKAVGNNGQVIIDILPSFEKVIGSQGPLPDVGMAESQNRFLYTFRRFMMSLPSEERPLVLFLDDMQNADIPSIKLVQMLLESAIPHLLIICGYRDSEVDEAHPLSLMLRELQNRELPFEKIAVAPLSLSSIEELIGDALYKKPEQVHDLAELSYKKSGGNPFFLLRLLENFYKNDWIFYDWESALWQWELEKIRSAPYSDNVAELMTAKIRALSPGLQELLSAAACIGSRFAFDELQLLMENRGEEELRALLESAIKEELILSDERRYYSSNSFHFAHDRIQEAVQKLLTAEKSVELHKRVAEQLEKRQEPAKKEGKGEKKRDGKLFTIVDHYNRALDLSEGLLQLPEEKRRHIASLNFEAAKEAKRSAAYEIAIDYSEKSLLFLQGGDRERDYDRLMELYLLAMESAYLSDDSNRMEKYGEMIHKTSRSILESYPAYSIAGLYCMSKGDHRGATGLLLEALEKLGFPFPRRVSRAQVGLELLMTAASQLFTGRTIEGLADLPEMEDRPSRAFLELASDLVTSVYVSGKINIFASLICKGVRLSYRLGNCAKVTALYSAFAIILQDIGAIATSYRFAKLTLALCDAVADPKSRTTGVLAARCLSIHWKESLKLQAVELMKNYGEAVEGGNLQYAAYSLVVSYRYAFFSGTSLAETLQRVESYNKALIALKSSEMSAIHNYFHRFLVEFTYPEAKGIAANYSDERMQATAKGIMHSYEAMLGYLLRDFSRAAIGIERYAPYKEATTGTYDVAIFNFYKALLHLAAYREKGFKERLSSRLAILQGLFLFKKFSRHNPESHLHKLLLLKAEWARVRKRRRSAEGLYFRAIEAAKESGFKCEEALGNELAGRFFLAEGEKSPAALYIREACLLYERWGAKVKVLQLQNEFRTLLFGEESEQPEKPLAAAGTTLTETIKIGASHLDIGSMQKASEMIASTILLDELLKRLMDVVMEQAGADRGLLLVERGEEFTIEAESSKKSEETKLLEGKVATEKHLPLSLLQQSARNEEMIIIDDATEHSRFKNEPYIAERQVKSLLSMPLMNNDKITAMLYLENTLTKKAFTEQRYAPLQFLSSQLAMAIDNARLYQGTARLNEELASLNLSYERFVPKDFISLIGKKSILELLPGDYQEREMTILFMDIRSFTALSEAMTPQQNFAFINEFIGYMEPVIRANSGFIDKYIGDAIMALFPESADDGVICAKEMVSALAKYNVIRERRGDAPIEIGIGINSGKLILGTVGNEMRMDGTVISDAVNVASRVEHLTKEFGRPILFTESSYLLLDRAKGLSIEAVGETPIRGKKEKITLYTVRR